MDANRLKQIIEGALLAAGQTLDVKRLLELFANDSDEILQGKVTAGDIETALEAIVEDCEGRGFELKQVSSGWRFQVREETAQWVNRLWEEKPQKYSRAMLETLALIAYRQPITRGDIEEIRGVAVSSHIIKTLSERDWVKVVGHRDVPGRPSLYATTRTFLDYFNLKSLEELPSLGELADIEQLNSELNLEVKSENTGGNTENSIENSDSNDTAVTATDSDVSDLEADVLEQNPESEGINLNESENIDSDDIEQTPGFDSSTDVDEQAPVQEVLAESDTDEAGREEVVVDEETNSFVDFQNLNDSQNIDNSQIESVESREFESAPVNSDVINTESTENNERPDVVSEEFETQSEQIDIESDDEQDLSLAAQDPIDEENETELVSEPAVDETEIEAEPSSVEMENQDQLDDEESEEDEKPVEHKAKSLFDIS